MRISSNLKNVLSDIKSAASEVVTAVTVVTEHTHTDRAKRCDAMSLSPPETTPDVATQSIEDASLAGSATPATPVTPSKHDVPTFHALFSALERQPPVCLTEAREVERLLPVLCEATLVGVDTETTGLDPLTHRLRLVQFAVPGGPAVAVDT